MIIRTPKTQKGTTNYDAVNVYLKCCPFRFLGRGKGGRASRPGSTIKADIDRY